MTARVDTVDTGDITSLNDSIRPIASKDKEYVIDVGYATDISNLNFHKTN